MNYNFETIEVPQALKRVMLSLTPEEVSLLCALKEGEHFEDIERFLNTKFAQLPAKEEAEIKEYYDRKNCAELGIPYPLKKI